MSPSTSPPEVNDYRCDVCDFVYRPLDYDGIDLTEQPDDFVCPSCQATKSHFQVDDKPEDSFAEDADASGEDDEDTTGTASDTATSRSTKADSLATLKPRRVYTDTSDPSVSTLKELRDEGDLNPQPPYQRYEVWTPVKKSKLIESVLMGLPLPRFYFAENQDETQEVVDGQQRLAALFRFIDNEYALSGLKTLTDLNKAKWSNLDKKIRNRIKNFSLSTVLIQKESDPELRYDLFGRLNTGATGLNEQELRNAVYRGAYNDLIYRLANLDDWRKLHNLTGKHKRMADAEWVLRFMAFRDQTYLNFPDKSMTGFLNKQMEDNYPDPSAGVDKAEEDFKKAASLCRTVFGDKAFRRFRPGDANDQNGSWETKRVLALADVQLWGMTRFNKGQIVGKADDIREASIELTTEFEDLISENTSGKTRVERRFEMWKTMMDQVMTGSEQGPRIFPKAIKDQLWSEGHACARCGQEIHDFDDAHVDHKTPYSKGGKTEKANGQLMHRYCNRVKAAADPSAAAA
jgi:rubredoxin